MQISIVIPVYKENEINKIIDSIISNQTSITYEIIVVDGDNGSTIDNINSDNIVTLTSRKGRSFQMNEGFKKSSGDILLFLHADTFLPKNALENIVKALSSKQFSAGAFDITLDSENKIIKKIAQVASWRSRFLKLPFGDQAFFVKRDVFEDVGGFKEIALMEDINFIQKLKKKKYKITILEDKILTSARKWESKGAVLNTLKNLTLQLLYFLGVHPNTLAKYYK